MPWLSQPAKWWTLIRNTATESKAGRTYCNDYRFLGLLPAPVKGWSDITRLYITKFGVPPPNTRVFIRTWQQVNGWENRGQMKLTNALVPIR